MSQKQQQIALVTGGGRGLGQALSLALSRDGIYVLAADLYQDLAEQTLAAVKAQRGQGAALQWDVADPQASADHLRHICKEYGRLDIVVNNAGIDETLPIEELSVERWQRILATNLSGPFYLTRQALPVMKQQGRGHIINIVSTAAKRAWAHAAAYHASKWGLLGFSHALHTEARPFGVKVTAVVCGGMRTPFLLERFPGIDTSTLQEPRNVAEVVCQLLKMPDETVIPEIMVLPLGETSWP